MVQSTVSVQESITLHHVEVIVNIRHNFIGHLDIRLTSPFGTESIFAEEHHDGHSNYDNWKFSTLLIWGEVSIGHWTLTIIDTSSSPDPDAVLVSWTLNLYGIQNITAYKDIFWPKQESSVWDLRGESVSRNKPPNNSSYEWLQNATDSVWKIVLMATLICGIFIMVVAFIVVFIVRRDNRQGHYKDDFISLEIDSDSSNSI